MSVDNVEDITPRIQYVATGGQRYFDYPFPIFAEEDLIAAVDGGIAALAAVSGVGDDTGGTADFGAPGRAAGEIVTLYRDMPINRLSDAQQNGPQSSQAFNDELDRIIMMIQQQKNGIERSLRYSVFSDITAANTLLDASTLGNKLLGFDSSGKPQGVDAGTLAALVTYGTAVTDVFIATAGQQVFTLSQNPGVIGNLDVSVDGVTFVPVYDFNWTDTTVTMTTGRTLGQRVYIRYMKGLPTGITQAAIYIPRTLEEQNASIFPVDYTYPVRHVHRYGALGNDIHDDTVAIQTALNLIQYVGSVGRGDVHGEVYFEACAAYKTTATLIAYKNTTLVGKGSNATLIDYDGTGVALTSTWPLNTSTTTWIGMRNMGIYCSGGAIACLALTGGTWIDAVDCTFGGNTNHNVILNQTEVSSFTRCHFGNANIGNRDCVWFVNGADYTGGALKGFTNRITFDKCNFNPTGTYCVVDDGGVNHCYDHCNFSGSTTAMRLAGVSGLSLRDCECENAAGVQLLFRDTTLAGAYVGPCDGGIIHGNTFYSTLISYIIDIGALKNMDIRGNVFGGYTAYAMVFSGSGANYSTGVTIEGNSKAIRGSGRTAGGFFNGFTSVLRNNNIKQLPMSYVPLALGSTGSQVVTLASTEYIRVGSRISCANEDGSNAENTVVTAVSGSTITAVFASTKAVNWTIHCLTPPDDIAGSSAFAAGTAVTVTLPFSGEGSTEYDIEITPLGDPVGRWYQSAKTLTDFTITSTSSCSTAFTWRLHRN